MSDKKENPKRKILPKSNKFNDYFAESVGISHCYLDGADLFDLAFMNRDVRPALRDTSTEDNKVNFVMENVIELNHVCTVRMTKTQLKELSELIIVAIGRADDGEQDEE